MKDFMLKDESCVKEVKHIKKDIRYRLKNMSTPCPVKETFNGWHICKVLDVYFSCDCEPKCKERLEDIGARHGMTQFDYYPKQEVE